MTLYECEDTLFGRKKLNVEQNKTGGNRNAISSNLMLHPGFHPIYKVHFI